MGFDLGQWGLFWLRYTQTWISSLKNSTNPWNPTVDGTKHLFDLLGFLAAVGDLLVHDPNCLGWGFCSIESPLCDSPWNGMWSPLLEDTVRLHLDGKDITDMLGGL